MYRIREAKRCQGERGFCRDSGFDLGIVLGVQVEHFSLAY